MLKYWPAASQDTPVFIEWGDEFVVRTGFYTGMKKEALDTFMKEYTIEKFGLDEYLN